MVKIKIKQQILTAVFIITAGITQLLCAQSSAYSGKEFIAAFGKNGTITTVDNTGNVQLILRIAAIENANVSIKFYNNASLNDNISVQAGEIRDYVLSYNQAAAAYSGSSGKSAKSIVVSATGEISLIAVNTANASAEATLVMPVERLGTEYIYTGLSYAGTGQNYGFFIVAAEDNTTVNFSNSVNAPSPNSITLNEGDVYAYYNSNVFQGLKINSTKPIAYFLNVTKARLSDPEPTGTAYYRENFNFEQIPPVNQWGTKFILPTVHMSLHNKEAIFVRIYSKEAGNTLQIKYSDGTTETYTYPSAVYHDFYIYQNKKPGVKAAYIESNSPVAVYIHHAPYIYNINGNLGEPSQPGVAWLPPVEQTIGSALVSPLDLNGKHVYLAMEHDIIIISPTATKNNTTISINGGQPQSLLSTGKFQWEADSIGNSGYSFGRYHFGSLNAAQQAYVPATALIENPNGIIALVYGQGSYTNYFYTVGAAARSLDMASYINGTHFDDVDGQAYCDIVYEITAVSNLPHSQAIDYPRWYFNDVEDTNLRGEGLVGHSSTEMILKLLPTTGVYTIKMEYKDAGNNVKSNQTTITVSSPPTVDTFSLPAFCDNSLLNPNPPVLTGGPVLSKGWQLETGVGSNVYNNINVPYAISVSDDGKRVRYYAETDCGKAYSPPQTIVIGSPVTPAVKISVIVN